MIDVVIGYDRRETVAAHVLAHSVYRNASCPVSVSMVMLGKVPLWRWRDPLQSTDFAFSRFLTPWMRGYEGWSIFMDCDMLCLGDVSELMWLGRRNCCAVSVVKHDYVPRGERKFLDQAQARYGRKNWSSVMVFDNARCGMLTPGYVNGASGLDLHQFRWLPDEEIGGLPVEWNHLVGEYEPNPGAKLVHFTLGTPCFKKYRDCEYSREWFAERDMMVSHDPVGEYSLPERVEE